MTTTRQFSQRLSGKLAKHHGYKRNNSIPGISDEDFTDLVDAEWGPPKAPTAAERMQTLMDDVPGLERGRNQPRPVSVDELLMDAPRFCRANKDGSTNRTDLKKYMREQGYLPDGNNWIKA